VRRLAIALSLSLAAGCTGSIQGGAGIDPPSGSKPGTKPGDMNPMGNPDPNNPNPGNPNMDPTKPPSAQVMCPGNGKEIVGKRALRRLTIPEFEATIRSAFALDAKQWVGLNVPPDSGSDDGFTNNVDRLTVSPEYARGAAESSRQVAALVSSDANLTKLLPCAATGDTACADSFVTSFGTKLYRRPLTSAEKARYMSMYDKTSKEGFKSFVFWATSTMLQSPNVIYRSELGEPDGTGRFKLTPYEVASQLSYTFTGGPPTPELMQLAATNKLASAADVETAARALVFDGQAVRPAFRDQVLRFTDQWLGLSRLSNVKKDATLYPDFNSQIQDSLAEETRRFISAVLLEDKGSVASLLTAPYTFVDTKLAKYYGFGAATGTDFAKITRPPEWGVGLLAQGSMLAVLANGLSTSPTRRGHMVRTTMMCVPVPPPPPVVDPIPEPTEAKTTRQRYEELHAANVACSGCHAMMDPIGFAFEHLDSGGRYRQKEGKFDINDSAIVTASSKGDLKVNGPTELAKAISTLPEVTDCMAAYLAAYALGVNHDSAQCLVSSATAELRNGMSVVDFYVRMARSEHFRFRQ
jgi:hypothetical protein